MRLVFQQRPQVFVLWLALFLSGLFSSSLWLGSAALSADSPVDLDANPPLTENDRQLRNWILGLFKTIKPNDEHRMFLELSLQESSYQYECRYLRQADGSVDVLPELTSDPDAKIRAFSSWHLRFDKNADIGLYSELYFEEIVLMHQGSRVYFSNIPGMTLGGLRYVNYDHDVDVLWKYGGYGFVSSAEREKAIESFDPRSQELFILSYLADDQRESGFICSAPKDVNIYEDHKRLYHPSRLKQLGL
ncbi:MAG: hypothetical protein CBB80_009115 [Synechococcus sp. TMED20]|jgi:hypothetical protein|nr:MAG: hypothetical protein CBB80_009115 [Synechococcus sp. TMED20]